MQYRLLQQHAATFFAQAEPYFYGSLKVAITLAFRAPCSPRGRPVTPASAI